jgi:MOSC domain-containing protein YiiM
MMPRIESISAGVVVPLWVREDGELRSVMSGIKKSAISTLANPSAVAITASGITSDEQADHLAHGGIEKALYAYPLEHYPHWIDYLSDAKKTAMDLPHGYFGENLTISGLTEDSVFVGDRWQVGGIECVVVKLRTPCYKFTARTGVNTVGKEMVRTGRSGWYLRIISLGSICAGDAITVIPGPRETSISEQNQALLKSQS